MKSEIKKEKTYCFIDASNIIYGAKAEGWFIDQKKLHEYLRRRFSVSKAFFYYGKDSKNAKKEAFLSTKEESLSTKKEGDPKAESSLSFINPYYHIVDKLVKRRKFLVFPFPHSPCVK